METQTDTVTPEQGKLKLNPANQNFFSEVNFGDKNINNADVLTQREKRIRLAWFILITIQNCTLLFAFSASYSFLRMFFVLIEVNLLNFFWTTLTCATFLGISTALQYYFGYRNFGTKLLRVLFLKSFISSLSILYLLFYLYNEFYSDNFTDIACLAAIIFMMAGSLYLKWKVIQINTRVQYLLKTSIVV
ncbi:MAG: hypothetical protein JHC93_03505 [Parachlamydiales bacterium]|nr:hypothetical protein [Parachlamydiales bacterium]